MYIFDKYSGKSSIILRIHILFVLKNNLELFTSMTRSRIVGSDFFNEGGTELFLY